MVNEDIYFKPYFCYSLTLVEPLRTTKPNLITLLRIKRNRPEAGGN